MAKIKRHFGEQQERMVIELGLCVGSTYREVDVNLVDRGGLNYQLLIGRELLKGRFLVDAGATFANPPDCKEAPSR